MLRLVARSYSGDASRCRVTADAAGRSVSQLLDVWATTPMAIVHSSAIAAAETARRRFPKSLRSAFFKVATERGESASDPERPTL